MCKVILIICKVTSSKNNYNFNIFTFKKQSIFSISYFGDDIFLENHYIFDRKHPINIHLKFEKV